MRTFYSYDADSLSPVGLTRVLPPLSTRKSLEDGGVGAGGECGSDVGGGFEDVTAIGGTEFPVVFPLIELLAELIS